MTLPQSGDYIAGKYRVERVIGVGGMGAVFEVSHRVTQKRFAIKWLLPEHAANAEAASRLIREAQVAGLFDHPNVVQVYDAYDVSGAHGRSSFIVMELLKGETLSDRLAREGRLSCAAACDILLPCVNALSAAHAKGIIHRDLKPANIFLCRAEGREPERAKLLDFGIAKLMPKGRGLDPMRTQTGMIMGTPLYMAPEQMRGRPVDQRADVYAMGVTLYQALSGELPFAAASLPELVLKITGEDPDPLERHVDDLPAGLAELVARAMARDPLERIQSMDELQRELSHYRDAPAPPSTYTPPPAGTRRATPPHTLLVTESTAALQPVGSAPLRWPWVLVAAVCIGVVAFALLREQWQPAGATVAREDAPQPEASGPSGAGELRSDSARERSATAKPANGLETTRAAATRAPEARPSGDVAATRALGTRTGPAQSGESRGLGDARLNPESLAATLQDARQAIEAASSAMAADPELAAVGVEPIANGEATTEPLAATATATGLPPSAAPAVATTGLSPWAAVPAAATAGPSPSAAVPATATAGLSPSAAAPAAATVPAQAPNAAVSGTTDSAPAAAAAASPGSGAVVTGVSASAVSTPVSSVSVPSSASGASVSASGASVSASGVSVPASGASVSASGVLVLTPSASIPASGASVPGSGVSGLGPSASVPASSTTAAAPRSETAGPAAATTATPAAPQHAASVSSAATTPRSTTTPPSAAGQASSSAAPASAHPAKAPATAAPAPEHEADTELNHTHASPDNQGRARPRFDLDRTDFPGSKPSSAPLERPKTRLGVGEF